ncbi:MAG: YHS domain-containing protein, partial [Smithella sp.]|nr:YHS domain-containing protein [Smithella sp.]
MKITDPVCKMTIKEEDAVATSSYKGKTYHFCSDQCKESFDSNP